MIDARDFHDVIDVIDELCQWQRRQRILRLELVALFRQTLWIVGILHAQGFLLRFQALAALVALRRNGLLIDEQTVEIYLDHTPVLRDAS